MEAERLQWQRIVTAEPDNFEAKERLLHVYERGAWSCEPSTAEAIREILLRPHPVDHTLDFMTRRFRYPDIEGVLALKGLLSDPQRLVRQRAVLLLGAMGKLSVWGLLPALRDKEWGVRWYALLTLKRFGSAAAPALPFLSELLEDPNPSLRRELIELLACLGPVAIPILLLALADRSRGNRFFALQALARLKPERGADIKSFEGRLGSDSQDDWAAVIEALEEMDWSDEPSEESLLESLNGADLESKKAVLSQVEQLERKGPSVLRHLVGLLLEPDPRLWDSVLKVLASLGAEALPRLIPLIQSPNPITRSRAVEVLGRMGAAASPAHPILLAALPDEEPAVTCRMVQALSQMGRSVAPQASPVLARLLGSSDFRIKMECLKALGSFGPDARSSVPALRRCLDREGPSLRIEAYAALDKIDSSASARYLQREQGQGAWVSAESKRDFIERARRWLTELMG